MKLYPKVEFFRNYFVKNNFLKLDGKKMKLKKIIAKN